MRKKPLERTTKRPFRILRQSSRVETVSALVTANGNQRRNPLLKIAMVVFEAGNRKIAAIGYGHNRTGRTKIDSKPHAYSLPAVLPGKVPGDRPLGVEIFWSSGRITAYPHFESTAAALLRDTAKP